MVWNWADAIVFAQCGSSTCSGPEEALRRHIALEILESKRIRRGCEFQKRTSNESQSRSDFPGKFQREILTRSKDFRPNWEIQTSERAVGLGRTEPSLAISKLERKNGRNRSEVLNQNALKSEEAARNMKNSEAARQVPVANNLQ